MDEGDESMEADAEGDGDGDTSTGDGDGDTSTGDGDGDTSTGDGDTSTGDGDTGEAVCGDEVREGDEECDGNDLGGQSCLDFGFQDGTLVCGPDCTFFTEACSTCGNGQIEGTEACDGDDFGGTTCAELGFDGGSLACSGDCSTIVDSGCMQAPTCGNGVIDPGEGCDGANLNGQTCQSLGYDGGTLTCTAGCQLDTNGCTVEMCVPLLGACNLLFDDCCDGLVCLLAYCAPE